MIPKKTYTLNLTNPVFASNKTLKFSHVLFYDDATNTNASDNERKKVNI